MTDQIRKLSKYENITLKNKKVTAIFRKEDFLNYFDIFLDFGYLRSDHDVDAKTSWKCSEMNVSDLIEIPSKYELPTLRNKKVM